MGTAVIIQRVFTQSRIVCKFLNEAGAGAHLPKLFLFSAVIFCQELMKIWGVKYVGILYKFHGEVQWLRFRIESRVA